MDKLFSFHGIDHKVGVTMIAQSVAELIANERKDLKILLITLNGRKNAGYVKENIETIDNYRMQIDSKIIISKDFLGGTKRYENLHMLAGLMKESEERLKFEKNRLMKVKNVDYGKQAEMEYRSLIEFRDDKYKSDIGMIANHILLKMGKNEIDSRKKSKWKSFI